MARKTKIFGLLNKMTGLARHYLCSNKTKEKWHNNNKPTTTTAPYK